MATFDPQALQSIMRGHTPRSDSKYYLAGWNAGMSFTPGEKLQPFERGAKRVTIQHARAGAQKRLDASVAGQYSRFNQYWQGYVDALTARLPRNTFEQHVTARIDEQREAATVRRQGTEYTVTYTPPLAEPAPTVHYRKRAVHVRVPRLR